jgi:hypothetical protein
MVVSQPASQPASPPANPWWPPHSSSATYVPPHAGVDGACVWKNRSAQCVTMTGVLLQRGASTAPHSTAQHSTAQHSTAQHAPAACEDGHLDLRPPEAPLGHLRPSRRRLNRPHLHPLRPSWGRHPLSQLYARENSAKKKVRSSQLYGNEHFFGSVSRGGLRIRHSVECKTTAISVAMREKKQRLEVVRGVRWSS